MDLSPSEWSVHLEDTLAHATPAGSDARVVVRIEQHAQHEMGAGDFSQTSEGQRAAGGARVRTQGLVREATGRIAHRASLESLLTRASAQSSGTTEDWVLPEPSAGSHGDPLCGWNQDDSALLDSVRRLRGELPGRIHVLLVDRTDELALIADAGGGWRADRRRIERLLVRIESQAGAVVEALESVRPEESAGGFSDAQKAAMLHRLKEACVASEGGSGSVDFKLPIVLRPAVAAAFLCQAGSMFHGAVAMKTPGLAKSLNKRLFPSVMTIRDSSRTPMDVTARSFDDEGSPVLEDVLLVDQGRLNAFLGTRASARAAQGSAQGRAFLSGDDSVELTLAPRALHIVPQAMVLPEDYTELCARFETFTSSRHGLTTLIVGGYTVRQGRRVEKLRPLDLNLPALDVLRKVRGVGEELVFFPSLQNVGTPSLLCDPFWPS